MSNKKCFLCKVEFDLNDLIKREIGDKNKKERNVCPQCYENYINRKMFFEYFHEVLDIPKLDKTTVIILNSMGKTSGWEIMLHALRAKEKAIVDNVDKGFRYIIGILRNQTLLSEREIRRMKKEKLNKPKIIEESNIEEITIRIPKRAEVIEKEIEF